MYSPLHSLLQQSQYGAISHVTHFLHVFEQLQLRHVSSFLQDVIRVSLTLRDLSFKELADITTSWNIFVRRMRFPQADVPDDGPPRLLPRTQASSNLKDGYRRTPHFSRLRRLPDHHRPRRSPISDSPTPKPRSPSHATSILASTHLSFLLSCVPLHRLDCSVRLPTNRKQGGLRGSLRLFPRSPSRQLESVILFLPSHPEDCCPLISSLCWAWIQKDKSRASVLPSKYYFRSLLRNFRNRNSHRAQFGIVNGIRKSQKGFDSTIVEFEYISTELPRHVTELGDFLSLFDPVACVPFFESDQWLDWLGSSCSAGCSREDCLSTWDKLELIRSYPSIEASLNWSAITPTKLLRFLEISGKDYKSYPKTLSYFLQQGVSLKGVLPKALKTSCFEVVVTTLSAVTKRNPSLLRQTTSCGNLFHILCSRTLPFGRKEDSANRLANLLKAISKHCPRSMFLAFDQKRGMAPFEFRFQRLLASSCEECQTVDKNGEPIFPTLEFLRQEMGEAAIARLDGDAETGFFHRAVVARMFRLAKYIASIPGVSLLHTSDLSDFLRIEMLRKKEGSEILRLISTEVDASSLIFDAVSVRDDCIPGIKMLTTEFPGCLQSREGEERLTPLMVATQNGFVRSVECLLSVGPHEMVLAEDASNMTAFAHAVSMLGMGQKQQMLGVSGQSRVAVCDLVLDSLEKQTKENTSRRSGFRNPFETWRFN